MIHLENNYFLSTDSMPGARLITPVRVSFLLISLCIFLTPSQHLLSLVCIRSHFTFPSPIPVSDLFAGKDWKQSLLASPASCRVPFLSLGHCGCLVSILGSQQTTPVIEISLWEDIVHMNSCHSPLDYRHKIYAGRGSMLFIFVAQFLVFFRHLELNSQILWLLGFTNSIKLLNFPSDLKIKPQFVLQMLNGKVRKFVIFCF